MNLVDPTRIIQHSLSERGFTGIDVSRNPDVAELLQRLVPPDLLLLPRACGGGAAGGEVAQMEIPGEQSGSGGLRRRADGRRAERV